MLSKFTLKLYKIVYVTIQLSVVIFYNVIII